MSDRIDVAATVKVVDQATAPIQGIERALSGMRGMAQSVSRAFQGIKTGDMGRGISGAATAMAGLAGHTRRFLGPLTAMAGLAGGISFAGLIRGVQGYVDSTKSLGAASKRFGVTVQAMSEFRYMGQRVGIDTETMDRRMDTFNRNLGKAATGKGNDLTKLLRRLHISSRDSNGSLRTANELLPQLADAYARTTNPIVKNAIATAMFGKAGGSEMARLLGLGADGIKRMREESIRLNPVTDQSVKEAKEFADAQKSVKISIGAVANAIYRGMLPVLSPFMLGISDLIKELTPDAILAFKEVFGALGVTMGKFDTKKAAQSIREWVKWIYNGIQSIGGFRTVLILLVAYLNYGFIGALLKAGYRVGWFAIQVIAAAASVVRAFVMMTAEAIISAARMTASVLVSFARMAVGAAIAAARMAAEVLVSFARMVAGAIAAGLRMAAQVIASFATMVWGGVVAASRMAAQVLVSFARMAAEAIASAAKMAAEVLVSFGRMVVEAIAAAVKIAAEVLVQFARMAAQAIISAASMATGVLLSFATMSAGAIASMWAMARGIAAAMMSNPVTATVLAIGTAVLLIYVYWDQLVPYFTALWDSVKGLFDAAVGWLATFYTDFVATPIKAAWDGLAAWFDVTIWQPVKKAFDDAVAWLAPFFAKFVWDPLKAAWEPLATFFETIWTGVKKAFDDAYAYIKPIIDKITAAADVVGGIAGSIGKVITAPPASAGTEGGIVPQPGSMFHPSSYNVPANDPGRSIPGSVVAASTVANNNAPTAKLEGKADVRIALSGVPAGMQAGATASDSGNVRTSVDVGQSMAAAT